MARNIEYLSPRKYMKLSENLRSRYIATICDNKTDEATNFEPDEDEEEILHASVSNSEDEQWEIDNEILSAAELIEFVEESDEDTDEESVPISSGAQAMIARDGTVWSHTPTISREATSHNAFRERSGPTRITENMSMMECFNCYFSLEMADIIVRCTNRKAIATYEAYNSANPTKPQLQWKSTTLQEIYAFIGILIMSGATHSNDENPRDLWGITSYPLYRATMGLNRFWELLRFIRFDDVRTRKQRQRVDRAAPIRDIWTMMNANLARYYKPTENLTIDQQLYPYRGRTKFTQYMPSKPAKCGIKVWWICDAKNSYPLHGQLYVGEQTKEQEVGLGERVVQDLVQPYHGSGRTITMDSYFTTLPLAKQLLSFKLNVVGTLLRNEAYIPDELKADKDRKVGTCEFGFHEEVTLLSYKQSKTHSLLMLSTLHHDEAFADNGKPEMLNFYNQHKGDPDFMDHTLREYSSQRHTQRWPLSLFFNIIDISAFAAYRIFSENQRTVPNKSAQRKTFLRKLAEELCMPVIEERAMNRHVTRHFSCKLAIDCYMRIPIDPLVDAAVASNSRDATGRKPVTGCCYICVALPEKRRRKTRKGCNECHKPICNPHSKTITKCYTCFNA